MTMLCRCKTSPVAIQEFLLAQAKLDFIYSAVGATATVPPAGYVVDHTRIQLGQGEAVFRGARGALERWQQFRLGWVEAGPPGALIQVGQEVAVFARLFGLWWLNARRIVYLVDEPGRVQRFGFANRCDASDCSHSCRRARSSVSIIVGTSAGSQAMKE